MALQITTPIDLKNGLTLSSAYARVGVVAPINGQGLSAHLIVYKDKNAYLNGIDFIKTSDYTLIDYIDLSYNREVDGADTLDIAHNAFIASLATQGITATKDLD